MGPEFVAGVDEAGRGPLAGPVVAAAVILPTGCVIPGLRDSKKLGAAARDRLATAVRTHALCWHIQCAQAAEIDALNILVATMAAMRRAVNGLMLRPTLVKVDGNQAPALRSEVQTIVGGDDLEVAISAASVLAKVYRDTWMVDMDRRYPGYGFAQHKGYGTRRHLEALQRNGASALHRRSFEPVRQVLERKAH